MNIYYTGYVTRNSITGQLYYGVHRTTDWNDSYLGSGKLLRQEIQKYGKHNFRKRVIALFNNSDEMWEWEKSTVTEEVIKDSLYYNIVKGGLGIYGRDISPFAHPELFSDEWHRNKHDKMVSGIKKSYQKIRKCNLTKKDWQLGVMRAKSPESNKKRIETFKRIHHAKGNKNSQYGTCWITNGQKNKKIKKEDDIPLGWVLGRTI